MKYKKTLYMHSSKTEKELLLLNTLNSKTIRVKGQKMEEVEKCLENPNTAEDTPIWRTLLEAGFLVEETLDEFSEAEKIYNTYREDNENVLHLIILPTEDCNFRCWYCYEEHNRGKMEETVMESIVQYVERNIHKYNILIVGWFGGEPLKQLDVIEDLSKKFISICKKYKKGYTSNITTNGYLLSTNVFKKLLECEIRDYQITIDGTKEVHDKNRYLKNHQGTYDRIVQNLKDIRDNYPEEDYTINIRTNISQDVKDVIEEHIKILEEEFSGKMFAHLMKITWECGVKNCSEKEKLLEQKVLHEILKKCKGSKLTFEMNMKQHFLFGQVCYASSKHSFVIGANGNIYKCTIHMEEKDKIGKLLPDGTMQLNNELFTQWTEKVLEKKQYENCKTCPVYPICFGISCPNRNGELSLTCPAIIEYIDDYMQLFSSTETNYSFYDEEII